MDGPDVERAPRLVPDHVAHFDEQTRQSAVRNEGSRPELLVDPTLRYGLWTVFEEELKELERLGLDVDRLTAEEQLARIRVQQAFAETDPHPPPFESESCIIPRSRSAPPRSGKTAIFKVSPNDSARFQTVAWATKEEA